jgi:hypothetical protein
MGPMFALARLAILFIAISMISWIATGVRTRRTWIDLLLVFVGTLVAMAIATLLLRLVVALEPLPDVIAATVIVAGAIGGRQAQTLARRWQRPWWR